jgi:hypothetical protein
MNVMTYSPAGNEPIVYSPLAFVNAHVPGSEVTGIFAAHGSTPATGTLLPALITRPAIAPLSAASDDDARQADG